MPRKPCGISCRSVFNSTVMKPAQKRGYFVTMASVGTLLTFLIALPIFAQSTGQVATIDKNEFLRHVQSWQLPEYPRKSASERHTGVVAATVRADDKGHVGTVSIVSAPDSHMAETVKSFVSQWIFRPFTESGIPKAAESTIYIQFRLQPMGPNVNIPGLTDQPEQTPKAPFKHTGK